MNKYNIINDKNIPMIKLKKIEWENYSVEYCIAKINDKEIAEILFDKNKNEFVVNFNVEMPTRNFKCKNIKEAKKIFIESIESFINSVIEIKE
jgi:hypothetical protein